MYDCKICCVLNISGDNWSLANEMGLYNKYRTMQLHITHTHSYTLQTHYLVTSTLSGDHQAKPSAPTTYCVTSMDIWRVTSRVIIIIIIIINNK